MSVTLGAEAAQTRQPIEVVDAQQIQTETRQVEPDPSRKYYDRIKSKWSKIDTLEVVALPFEQRSMYASMSLKDANFCHRLIHDPRTLGMKQFPQFYRRCLSTEIDLRMGALIIAPEIMDDEIVDNLVQVGMELSQQLGPGRERDFNDINKLNKLHDIQALEALWMARGALTYKEKMAAKIMLGDSIADAMSEIVSLTKRIEKAVSHMGESIFGEPGGILAEFMLVTWERLNLYIASHNDIDVLSKVFIRSSLDLEDKLAANPNRSIDAVITNLDRNYSRLQQYKSSPSSNRKYDKPIEVVHIPDWRLVMDNIQDVARQFDIILSPYTTNSAKEDARLILGDYFEHARVERVAR